LQIETFIFIIQEFLGEQLRRRKRLPLEDFLSLVREMIVTKNPPFPTKKMWQ
jgi:hypothetical protein